MSTRNFGLGSRDMQRAGEFALSKARQQKAISFSSEHKYKDGWRSFCNWARAEGVKKMENVTRELVTEYGRELAQRVHDKDLAPSTAQNLVTAVNKVMGLATVWRSVSSTKECEIPQRSHVREGVPDTLYRGVYNARLEQVRGACSERAVAVVELCRELGLRSKEASLFDAKSGLSEALKNGALSVSDGTKGGRERKVPITLPSQLKALERAVLAQGNHRALMPPDKNWSQWREGALREARQIMGGLHELRSAYACERYQTLTGHAAPCAGGEIADRETEKEYRLAISEELGHGRVEVVNAYVGGRR